MQRSRGEPDVEREESAAPLPPDEGAIANEHPTSGGGSPDDGSAVAAKLRTTREREGLSIGTLASLLGLPERTLEDVEAGDSVPHEAVERVRTWLAGNDPDLPPD